MGLHSMWALSGSSPLTRGAHLLQVQIEMTQRLIPAYAGSTLGSSIRSPCLGAHPRLRGEHSVDLDGIMPYGGSSPLTRGALCQRGHDLSAGRLIPAYAGSTLTLVFSGWRAQAHPRLRGEHPWNCRHWCRIPGSSPLTRGAPFHRRFCWWEGGSSPLTRGARPCWVR